MIAAFAIFDVAIGLQASANSPASAARRVVMM
jgi:hypothetical protein